MAKLSPADRWKTHILEQIKALRLSDDLRGLRARGLTSLGRKRMYSFQEWWDDFGRRATSPTYRRWYEECSNLAERFRLVPWVVSNLCLLKGYRPENEIGLMVMESDWPRVRFVTDSNDETFLRKLSYNAQQVGVYVIQRRESVENLFVNADQNEKGDYSNSSDNGSVTGSKFFVRVETPLEYPPEAAAQLHREASQLAKELARQMGYDIPKRLRASKLVPMAEDLRVTTKRLPRGGSYDIIDRTYADDLGKDQKRRKLISSRRHKLRVRLLKPYEPNSNPGEQSK